MTLKGARLVGVLLVWMSLGFAIDAVTSDYQYDLAQETGQAMEPRTLQAELTRYAIAAALASTGLVLMVRDPGQGPAPGVALGSESVTERMPGRCWRCRKKWPAHLDRCPKCGAERLQ